jgi:hypothetical protein
VHQYTLTYILRVGYRIGEGKEKEKEKEKGNG